MPKSFKPEVIVDNSGVWCGNGLHFATFKEAEKNVKDLAVRWFLVTDIRVSTSEDLPNYRYVDHKLVKIEETVNG
jgi:hypothetical protein